MPLHSPPKTRAEELALHLEMNYGLQLDPTRHKLLVEELDGFLDREFEDGQTHPGGRPNPLEIPVRTLVEPGIELPPPNPPEMLGSGLEEHGAD